VLFKALSVFSDVCWTLVYIDMINQGFKDETYGMPLFALAFNISWEFIFSFLIRYGEEINLQEGVNAAWFLLDAVIVYTCFRYGKKHFPDAINKRWFLPWSLIVLAASFITVYFAGLEFSGLWGASHSAFAQNLMMSVLFMECSYSATMFMGNPCILRSSNGWVQSPHDRILHTYWKQLDIGIRNRDRHL